MQNTLISKVVMNSEIKFKKLPLNFFSKPTLKVARNLIGKLIVRKRGKNIKIIRILETEAYIGEKDLACHASCGKTQRNFPMYQQGGIFYVYFVYGMHWMLNVVTERKNFPAAILIRAGEDINNKKVDLKGPAKITKYLKIAGKFNGIRINKELFFAEEKNAKKFKIKRAKRVGVDYAKDWANKKWRFVLYK
jgi:DNA-3-methyladenine glycosylase